jgi:hypothetical protein
MIYITQFIKIDFYDMDSYYATCVYCCKRIFICRMSIDLYSNVLIKFINDIYDLKYKNMKVMNIKYN